MVKRYECNIILFRGCYYYYYERNVVRMVYTYLEEVTMVTVTAGRTMDYIRDRFYFILF